MNQFYYVLDGDDVGRKFENYIFNNNLKEAIIFSEKIKYIMDKISNNFIENGASCSLNAGDSLIFTSTKLINLNKINLIFEDVSFSMGIGQTILEASLNLKIAKATGKKTYSNLELIKENL